jgi:hypothetical protein
VELDRLNRLRETRLRKVKKKPILKPINFSTWFFVVVENQLNSSYLQKTKTTKCKKQKKSNPTNLQF